jgi:hypothetical protein
MHIRACAMHHIVNIQVEIATMGDSAPKLTKQQQKE